MNPDPGQEQIENISAGGLRLNSHGGQFALGPRLLKDRPEAGRGAARQGRVLDKPRPQGSHHP